jgi:predicted phage terminase large subunit-like protein
VLSAGIFGTITGNPASLFIIDDPYKSNLEAESEDYRNKVLDVAKYCVETRLSPLGSALLIIHTRWHEDDLIGYYSKQNGVIYINIPCVWEKGVDKLLHRQVGDILSPELGHTPVWVEKMKKSLGRKRFSALYQGQPFVEGGNIIKREHIKFYNKGGLPPRFDEMVMSCDLSFGATSKDSDPNAILVWGRVGAYHYLVDWWNKKCGFQETMNMIKLYRAKYEQCRKILIENKANGRATIEMLQQQIGGVVGFDPKTQSKEQRFTLVAPYFESGNVFFPSEKVKENIEEIIEQLLKFPNMAHDEYVDTTSQYLLDYSYKYDAGRILTDDYYSTISDAFRGLKI